jgi:hypothetical protein
MDISPSVISDSFIFQGDEDPQLFLAFSQNGRRALDPIPGGNQVQIGPLYAFMDIGEGPSGEDWRSKFLHRW